MLKFEYAVVPDPHRGNPRGAERRAMGLMNTIIITVIHIIIFPDHRIVHRHQASTRFQHLWSQSLGRLGSPAFSQWRPSVWSLDERMRCSSSSNINSLRQWYQLTLHTLTSNNSGLDRWIDLFERDGVSDVYVAREPDAMRNQ